ncbi:TPA: MFS transporter [Kluyvera intermedia]|mgnify:FL=1|uniref:Symporter YagG n=2 Tax=Enterobacteriaceae TaxID=543 RepID=A0AAC8QRY9_9ENTR|nr:glycoside-pentoside-hexuronide (GPH):cation symporter [Phytobacter ursingii]HAT2207862.1 MFS transporter [Kluyvera intermedia]AKL13848.1 symporter YagG [Phytobacter ursingii]HAT2518568.1 MFS transporter [Kluyvera intermedia]HAT2606609.1 MFS transporter [Kluyvera intermedia]HAT2682416.1 MFS transporter [Kluyvera intermedia]
MQLTMKDKIGYGLGDTACGFVWQATMFLLAYFYTDVFGLSAGVMGTLFLISRVLDAVTDPLMGLVVDRTRTRYGQFRPYLLWGAIPFGIVCVLTFYTPDFSAQGKIIYASITYILLTLVYTFVNVPYCAMPGVITSDPKERHALQSWRFFLAAAGSLAISGIALPLVNIIGKGNEQVGYFGAMCVLGICGVILLFVCFFTTKERYTFDVQPGASVKKDLKLLMGNSQWRIMCAFKMMATGSNVVRGGATLYFVKYVMDHPELATQFLLYGSLATMFGSLCSSRLLGRFDRVTSFKWIIVLYSLISLSIFFIPANNIALIFALNILFLFVFNTTTPLQWLMASDVVDYEESRSGRRLDGLVFSTYLFSLKIGLAIGGALVGWILAFSSYSASNAVQPDNVLTTIKILFCIVPVVLYAGMFTLLSFYKLSSKRVEEISLQLQRQRAAHHATQPADAAAAVN